MTHDADSNHPELVKGFQKLAENHREATRHRISRVILGPSVIRVFNAGTKEHLLESLTSLPIDDLPNVTPDRFRKWFEQRLARVHLAIEKKNQSNQRIHPGIKWGHATKVLCLYLRDVVLHRECFEDRDTERIKFSLYVPLDGVVIDRLRIHGCKLPFRKIREIDSPKKFYFAQETIASVAHSVGVPPIWFDDAWAVRD